MANKFLSMLHKDAQKLKADSVGETWFLSTDSPAINFLFGRDWGLRGGYSAMIYGPPKSGKSLLTFAFAGHLHQTDPEAIVLHFDTEFRDNMSHWQEAFKIDPERFISYQTNDPTQIFDYIATTVASLLQEGAKIKLIIIDSLAGILYPKEANREHSTDHVMGDAAAYLPGAIKMILPVIRKHKVCLLLCQHIRDNMDPVMSKYRPYQVPGGKGLKHFVESWILVEKILAKDAKVVDQSLRDGAGNNVQIGHRIRVKMEENSLGPQNRAVEIDLSYTQGIINVHEQIAVLAAAMGAAKQSGPWISYKDRKWQGISNFAIAIRDDLSLQEELVKEIKNNDLG